MSVSNVAGLVQDCRNSSALAMESLQPRTNLSKPSIYDITKHQ